MIRRLFVTLLVLGIVLPAAGQSRKELQEGPKRGWTNEQMHRWLDYQTQKPMRPGAAADVCGVTETNRRDAILNGNKITTQIFNFGSISAPGNRITDIVWNGLGYGYEFGPFIAAEVQVESDEGSTGPPHPDAIAVTDGDGNQLSGPNGRPLWTVHIVSDGLVSNGGEVSPDGRDFWGWQPVPCAQAVGTFDGLQVVEPTSDKIPTSDAADANLDGKPDSWPDAWYNETLEDYVWPGALQQGASNADKEALYFMNDYNNCEFPYDPFPSNPNLNCGLGLEVEVRLYQWANPLAEDAIFLIYKVTNKSERDLDNVIFGMWGDPHVGGPSNWQDDLASFDPELNMVYAWDDDGRSDIAGREPGYFGYKFLESPGIGNEIIGGTSFPGDGIDNDGDGLVDESWTDGIDNDGDWNPDTDDVGLDGIPGTGDVGEGDGVPTAGDPFDITRPGEPNFEFTDIEESDMIGLTSFKSPPFAGNRISNDKRVWDLVEPGTFDEVPEDPGDYVFMYGSGQLSLRAGETKRFSIALIVGESFEDLTLNAETVQDIYNAGYVFAKPPLKPIVRAVPGDQKVTLYWEDRAETSVDPLTRSQDFEGYVIYRSTDHEFSDQQTITDINGSAFLYEPLTTPAGVEAKFDLQNGLTGPSPVPYPRRGIAYDLGDDTGLFHTFVDSNDVVNGQTYFYTVVAYDRGSLEDGIPPSETTKTITYDPTTDSYVFDLNTVRVVPRPRAAGYVPPAFITEPGIEHVSGVGTGPVELKIIDPLAVPDGNQYRIDFDQTPDGLAYSVLNQTPRTVTITGGAGKASTLGVTNVEPSSVTVRTAGGAELTAGEDYTVNAANGTLTLFEENGAVEVTYTYYPIYQSRNLAFEEGNLVFDGMHLFVENERLELDDAQTGWIEGGDGLAYEVVVATTGPGRRAQPADYEIRFSDSPVKNGFNNDLPQPFEVVNLTRANEVIDVFTPDINQNGAWDVGEPLIFLETLDGTLTATWQLNLDAEGPQPGGGDVFFVRTKKPFTDVDAFTFATRAAAVDTELAGQQLDDIRVVPNPYVATNALEPRNPFSRDERGDRRLYFANVPQQCTIRIYTLAGELVDTIEHNSTIDDGKAFWDLRTKDNMNIAYGLYLYHVESEAGTHIGKFAVIK